MTPTVWRAMKTGRVLGLKRKIKAPTFTITVLIAACSTQKKSKISSNERITKLCERTDGKHMYGTRCTAFLHVWECPKSWHHAEADICTHLLTAYKVLVEDVVYQQSQDMYAMRVKYTIKKGWYWYAFLIPFSPFGLKQYWGGLTFGIYIHVPT